MLHNHTRASQRHNARRGRCNSAAATPPEGEQPRPSVLCGDRICRHTFVHCYHAMAPTIFAEAPPDLLERLLPPSVSQERQERLKRALPYAAHLLRASSSFKLATQEYFPGLTHDACGQLEGACGSMPWSMPAG